MAEDPVKVKILSPNILAAMQITIWGMMMTKIMGISRLIDGSWCPVGIGCTARPPTAILGWYDMQCSRCFQPRGAWEGIRGH